MSVNQWLVVALIGCLLGAALAGTDCTPFRYTTPGRCCPVRVFPADLVTAMGVCRRKKEDLIDNKICRDQCIFEETGMLVTDKDGDQSLNWAKIGELFRHENMYLGPVVSNAIEHCRNTYNSMFHVLESAKHCNSDPTDFVICFSRQVFLNCPKENQLKSTGCTDLKLQIIKCPEMEVIL